MGDSFSNDSFDKKTLRKLYKGKRAVMTEKYRDIVDNILYHKFVKYLGNFIAVNKIQGNLNIGAYFPIGSEINILAIINRVVLENNFIGHNQKNISLEISLPRISLIEKRLLEFKNYKGDENSLVMNEQYQIPEVAEDVVNVIPDIIICPLLAFDRSNYRLGYGGGFYDYNLPVLKKLKLNERNKKIDFIALAYSFMSINGDLVIEPHDYPLDYIIY